MANVEVTFYTHPSNWGNDFHPEIAPYDRVAGIAFEGEELWTAKSQLPGENSYRKTDTEALTLNLPRDFALPVVDYFHDFYADPSRFYQASDILKDVDYRRNCHRFGASVLKRCPQDIFTAYGIAAEIATTNKHVRGKRALGDLAVLAHSKNPFELKPTFAAHTMVSLGNALPGQYIHTVVLEGNLAISPLEPFFDDYNRIAPTDVSFQSAQANVDSDPQVVADFKKMWRRR